MTQHNISSSATIFYKYFLPTIWIVFFGSLLVIFWFLVGDVKVGGVSSSVFKIGYTVFFLLGIAALYYTVIPIKRVHIDENYIYVTNYLKIFKYPFFNIEEFKEKDFSLFKTVTIAFREPGTFGKKVTFVASKNRYKKFLEEYPEIMERLQKAINGDLEPEEQNLEGKN